jgi:hypothetical protein
MAKTQAEITTIKKDLLDQREALRARIDFIGFELRAIIRHEHGRHKGEPRTICPACE